MNILVLHNNYSTSALQGSRQLLYYTLPETALQRNGKPVFLPDYANPAWLEMHFAVRISRLGRHISERFAHRYYDAATVIPHFIAPALWEKAQCDALPWDVAMGFDNAVALGDFVSIEPESITSHKFRLLVDGEEKMAGATADGLHHVDAAIAELSQYFTLRRGDILLTGSPQMPISIAPDHRIETFLDDKCVLSFNVK